MRRSGAIVTCALVAAVAYSDARAEDPDREPRSSWQAAKEDFATAYDAVRSGLKKTAVAGKYAIKDAGNGAVEVSETGKRTLSRTGGKADDAWITTKVKGEFATTAGIKSGDIDVHTDRGVVRLSGTVDSAHTAERAIHRALAVKGVVAVESSLQYPTRVNSPRVHTPTGSPREPR
jgi:hyperosmotically inducible periplasmic protein